MEVIFKDATGNALHSWITPDISLTNLVDKTNDHTIYLDKSIIPNITDVDLEYRWAEVR